MFDSHVGFLVCPSCQNSLHLSDIMERDSNFLILEGSLSCSTCSKTFAIHGGIPRFVPEENYSSSFGIEWTIHARTQYDSYSGQPISARRFFSETEWPRKMQGELILEVGCGSVRFTEQALSTGTTVLCLDYSCAVEANYKSHGSNPNCLIVQADACLMPFKKRTFDRVFCLGVLQHTPDVKKTLLPRCFMWVT